MMLPASNKQKDAILLIDDSPETLLVVNDLLKDDYRLQAANRGEKGLRLAIESSPDLILLDVMMPDLNGHEVCLRLKETRATRDIPVIFLTAMDSDGDEHTGLSIGAVDYITKPISGAILKARIKTHLTLKHAADFVRDKNQFLAAEVAKRAQEVDFVQDVTILALASLAETRDNETGNHIRRTQHYVRALAERLARHPHFSLRLTRTNIDLIFKSAPLHDIGKVGIPDAILLKPGKLTDDEFRMMQDHARLGFEAIEHAERELGRSAPFLGIAKEIALGHHEKWDGSGYPAGIAGHAIPIPARLMAVADVYDALIAKRTYKAPIAHDEAVKIILKGRGSHFDPDIVDAFLELASDFATIAGHFADTRI